MTTCTRGYTHIHMHKHMHIHMHKHMHQVGVAHFCGEPEHDDEEEEEVEEEAAEMGGHLGEAQADATGSTAHSSIIPSPPRRLREVWTTHGGGGGGAASSPNRGGGGSMMQRSMSMGRRKTLMETYRAVGSVEGGVGCSFVYVCSQRQESDEVRVRSTDDFTPPPTTR